MTKNTPSSTRNIIFISKATPEDDEFVLWLAPRLEAAGYTIFADILTLEPGDRWRKQVTNTLQDKSIKMLLCCRDSTLQKDGVQEEIGIASDLVRELSDPRFIIPLRLEKFKKVFGIGELQWVDFLGGWASGLQDLLETLDIQKVPRLSEKIVINPNWESYKKRLAVRVEQSPEILTSNWVRILSVPDYIRYYEPSGALNQVVLKQMCQISKYPTEIRFRGFFSFATPEEINREFANAGKFVVKLEIPFNQFLEQGCKSPDIHSRDAQNLVSSMFRRAWENFCRSKNLSMYAFSSQLAFYVGEEQVTLGKRISWGEQGQRRSSMLRNSAGGKVWQYGVSASPNFWPFPHFKMKSRVVFAELVAKQKSGSVIDDSSQQHRLRRSVCKGWRNKTWHGRFMTFLQFLSNDSQFIDLPLSETNLIRLDVNPMFVSCPVTTALPDNMAEDAEEEDTSTLGNFDSEDD